MLGQLFRIPEEHQQTLETKSLEVADLRRSAHVMAAEASTRERLLWDTIFEAVPGLDRENRNYTVKSGFVADIGPSSRPHRYDHLFEGVADE